MKPIYKYITLTVGLSVVIAYLVFSAIKSAHVTSQAVCKRCDIDFQDSKVNLISVSEVVNLLQLAELYPIGKQIKDISTEAIEVNLKKNPMIKSVECYMTPSGAVTIELKQRRPKFRVVGVENYYIDSDGEKMPISPRYAAYVPTVSGRVTLSLAKGDLFHFVSFLEKNEFWNSQIVQIHISEEMQVELTMRVGDSKVILGDFNHYEAKLEKLHKLYLYGFNVVGWNKYKVINLEYKDQVVCSREEFKPHIVENELKDTVDSVIVSKL